MAVIFFGGVFAYQYFAKPDIASENIQPGNSSQNNDNQVACTMDAKLCPDGSYVGRVAPNCDFAPCPETTQTAGWKTYTNTQHKFEFQYPDSKMNVLKLPEGTICDIGNGTANCNLYSKPNNSSYNLYSGLYLAVVDYPVNKTIIHKYDGSVLINQVVNTVKQISIGGSQGYEYDLVSSTNYKIHGIIIPLNSNSYIEIYENSKEPIVTVSEWKKILSTFKFTNVRLTVWPDKNSFDMTNKTFIVEDLNTYKNVKIFVDANTKIYRQVDSNEYHDFQWLYSTLKNWEGPSWHFIVNGDTKSDGSVLASEIYYTVQ